MVTRESISMAELQAKFEQEQAAARTAYQEQIRLRLNRNCFTPADEVEIDRLDSEITRRATRIQLLRELLEGK